MGAILGAWQLVYIGSAVPCGAFLDRIGVRRGLVIACLLIAASGALRGIAGGFFSLFLAVGLFGFGGPLVSIGAPKLISQWFVGKERGLAMGIYVVGMSMGSVVALSLTNSVMMPFFDGDWRRVLIAYAVFVLCVTGIWLAIASHPASRERENRAAADRGKGHREVFGDLLRLRAVRIVLLMSIGIFVLNHGLNNWLPEILRSGGMSGEAAGYWASISMAAGVFGALIVPRLAIPSRRFAVMAALFVLAAVGIALLFADGAGLAAGLALQGFVRAPMMPIAMLVLIEARGVDIRNTGAAGGLFFAAAEIGGVGGPLALGLLSDWTGGFAAGIDLLVGVSLLLLGLLWLLRRDQHGGSASTDNA
jgi:cyanate permease